MRENTDQNNSEYGHFLRSELCKNELLHKKTSTRVSHYLDVMYKIYT